MADSAAFRIGSNHLHLADLSQLLPGGQDAAGVDAIVVGEEDQRSRHAAHDDLAQWIWAKPGSTESNSHLGRGCGRSGRRLLRALGHASTDALPRVLVASFGSARPASQSASSDRWIRAQNRATILRPGRAAHSWRRGPWTIRFSSFCGPNPTTIAAACADPATRGR